MNFPDNNDEMVEATENPMAPVVYGQVIDIRGGNNSRPVSVKMSENGSMTSNETEEKPDFVERIIAMFDPTSGRKPLKKLTYAQRSMFLSIKASSGLMIVGYFAIFIGVVFWSITEIYYIEAARTDKSYKLLRNEGRGWVICGCIGVAGGALFCLYVLRRMQSYLQSHPKVEPEFLGSNLPPPEDKNRIESVESGIFKARTNTELLAEAIQLPVSPELLNNIIYGYLMLFADPKFVLADEMKTVLIRTSVFHKKPYQFVLVILVQIVLSVSIGVFSYGHGSAGSAIVCTFYIIYLLIGGAGNTIQYLKSLWAIVTHNYMKAADVYHDDAFRDVFEIVTMDDGSYGLMVFAVGWQCYVIAQAYSVSGEAPVLNFEHIMVTVVSLMVRVTSVCVALLAPDAATAAGTLVTFDFIAQFDDQFIALEAKYLKPEDFERIRARPLFFEDFYAVFWEIIFIGAAGSAVTNAICGLVF